MVKLLLSDVSFGFWDVLLTNPWILLFAALGIFLIVKGVKAIRRELAKKNAQAAEPAAAAFYGAEEEPPANEIDGPAAADPPAEAGPSVPEAPHEDK